MDGSPCRFIIVASRDLTKQFDNFPAAGHRDGHSHVRRLLRDHREGARQGHQRRPHRHLPRPRLPLHPHAAGEEFN